VSRKTNHFAASARFDANTDHHHHLICTRCNRTTDLEDRNLNSVRLPDAHRTGFKITDYSVYFEGLCPQCLEHSASTSKKTSAGASSFWEKITLEKFARDVTSYSHMPGLTRMG
jgi:hypothetical protein